MAYRLAKSGSKCRQTSVLKFFVENWRVYSNADASKRKICTHTKRISAHVWHTLRSQSRSALRTYLSECPCAMRRFPERTSALIEKRATIRHTCILWLHAGINQIQPRLVLHTWTRATCYGHKRELCDNESMKREKLDDKARHTPCPFYMPSGTLNRRITLSQTRATRADTIGLGLKTCSSIFSADSNQFGTKLCSMHVLHKHFMPTSQHFYVRALSFWPCLVPSEFQAQLHK